MKLAYPPATSPGSVARKIQHFLSTKYSPKNRRPENQNLPMWNHCAPCSKQTCRAKKPPRHLFSAFEVGCTKIKSDTTTVFPPKLISNFSTLSVKTSPKRCNSRSGDFFVVFHPSPSISPMIVFKMLVNSSRFASISAMFLKIANRRSL